MAERDGMTLSVVITRDGPVNVYGHGPTISFYGEQVTPPTGKAILSLYLLLPSIHEKR